MTTATKLVKTTDIDTLCINTIRTLSLDAVPVSYTHLTLPTTPYV